MSRIDPRFLYVGTQGPSNAGLYRSLNTGVDWEAHSFPVTLSGVSQFIPWDIGEDPLDGTLYVPTEIDNHPQPYHPPAFRSDDRGATWTNITGSLPWHGVRVIVQAPSHTVLFLTEGAGLFRSTDRGATWNPFGNASFADDLEIDPNNPSRMFGGDVYSSGRVGGVFLSTDGGVTFSPYGLDGRTCGSLSVAADSSRLYAACYNLGIFVRRLPQQ